MLRIETFMFMGRLYINHVDIWTLSSMLCPACITMRLCFTLLVSLNIIQNCYIPGYTLTLLNVHVLTLIAKQFHQKHRWK